MRLLRVSWLSRLTACLAMLLFAGDIIADAVADSRGDHCVSQSSQTSEGHEKAPCSHCACATHSGAVMVNDFGMRLDHGSQNASSLFQGNEGTPPRLPGSIDHPPQLG